MNKYICEFCEDAVEDNQFYYVYAYVLEINTAPGLEPRKLQLYAEYFKKAEREWHNAQI